MNRKKAVLATAILSLFVFPIVAYANLANPIFLPVIVKNYPEQTPSSTPTPGEAVILDNFTYFVEEDGDLHVFGEVLNDTQEHMELVKVTVNLYDSEGNLAGSEFTYVWIDHLPAGERSCFHLWYFEPPAWAVFEFEQPTYYPDGSPLPHLVIYDDQGSYDPDFQTYSISGLVLNDHGSRLEYVDVIGTLYNNENRVVGCDFTYVNSAHLEPNQVSSFDLTFLLGDLASVGSYRLQADGSDD